MSTTMEAGVESTSSSLTSNTSGGAARPAKPQPVGMRSLAAPHIVCVHVDGFFAAVEQALQRRFRGRPVAVGRERVVSASYETKLLGVTTGMTISQALQRCPTVKVVPGHFKAYAEYAERVRCILESFSPAVDAAADHGFYLNFFGSPWLGENYPGALRRLQLEILRNTGLSASIGAGRTRVAAAVAARLERPRGLRIVEPGTEGAFLASLPVDALHGIGGIDADNLRKRGISTIGALRRVPLAALQAAYGDALGRQAWENSRGNDCTLLGTQAKPGQLSRKVAVDGATMDGEYLSALMEYLCLRISCVLRDTRRRVRTVAVRVHYADQFTASKSLQLPSAAHGGDELLLAARGLFRTVFAREVAVQSLEVSAGNVISPDMVDGYGRSHLSATAAIA